MCTYRYHIGSYFRGVLIFVVHPDFTKFFAHEIFLTLCSAIYTCSTKRKEEKESSNLDRRCLLWLFFTTCTPLTVPLIHRVPLLKLSHMWWLKKWTQKAGAQPTENRASISHQTRKRLQYPFDTLAPQQTDQYSYYCIGIVAVFLYWPPLCLRRHSSLSCSLACLTQPTPGRIAFSNNQPQRRLFLVSWKRFALELFGSGLRN